MDSDHVPIEININQKLLPTKPTRMVMFNLKNEQGRKRVQEITSQITQFTDCLESMQSMQIQCEHLQKIVMSYCEKDSDSHVTN